MRYIVYRWELPCLDYPLEVSISWIYLLSPNNWFYHICLSYHLIPYSCSGVYDHVTIFNTCFRFRFIDTHMLVPACHLAFITPFVGKFLTPLDQHVQIMDLGSWWTSCWSEWLSRSVVAQRKTSQGPYPSRPFARFSSFLLWLMSNFVLFSMVYLFIFSHLRLSVM